MGVIQGFPLSLMFSSCLLRTHARNTSTPRTYSFQHRVFFPVVVAQVLKLCLRYVTTCCWRLILDYLLPHDVYQYRLITISSWCIRGTHARPTFACLFNKMSMRRSMWTKGTGPELIRVLKNRKIRFSPKYLDEYFNFSSFWVTHVVP